MSFLLLKTTMLKQEILNHRRKLEKRSIFMRKANQDDKLYGPNFIMTKIKQCRVCERAGEVNIFSAHRGRNLAEDMRQCSGIPVYMNDGLPHWLCAACLELLQGAVKFRHMCIRAVERLLNFTTTNNGKLTKSTTTNMKKTTIIEINPKPNMLKQDKRRNVRKKSAILSVKIEKLESKHDQELQLELTEDNIEQKADSSEDEASTVQDHQLDSADKIPLTPLGEPKPGSKVCIFCRGSFETLLDYYKHIRACYKLARERQAAKKSKKTTKKQKGVCEICGKVIASVYQMQNHRSTHMNVYPFKCKLCPFRSKIADGLKSHLVNHLDEKPFACDQCPRRFNNHSNRFKHVQRMHGKSVECSICCRQYRNSLGLEAHIKRAHSKRPLASCHICGEHFKERKYLYKHRIKQHNYRVNHMDRWAAYQQGDDRESETMELDGKKQQDLATIDS